MLNNLASAARASACPLVTGSRSLEHLNVYKKSSRKDAKIAKDAKLLFVILSLYLQDSYYFECNISCKTRIYRTRTLRLCALARGNSGIMFVKFKMLQTTSTLEKLNVYKELIQKDLTQRRIGLKVREHKEHGEIESMNFSVFLCGLCELCAFVRDTLSSVLHRKRI
jgi:hypothetical protein